MFHRLEQGGPASPNHPRTRGEQAPRAAALWIASALRCARLLNGGTQPQPWVSRGGCWWLGVLL